MRDRCILGTVWFVESMSTLFSRSGSSHVKGKSCYGEYASSNKKWTSISMKVLTSFIILCKENKPYLCLSCKIPVTRLSFSFNRHSVCDPGGKHLLSGALFWLKLVDL